MFRRVTPSGTLPKWIKFDILSCLMKPVRQKEVVLEAALKVIKLYAYLSLETIHTRLERRKPAKRSIKEKKRYERIECAL